MIILTLLFNNKLQISNIVSFSSQPLSRKGRCEQYVSQRGDLHG